MINNQYINVIIKFRIKILKDVLKVDFENK